MLALPQIITIFAISVSAKLIDIVMKTKFYLVCLLFSSCMALHAQSSQLEYRPFAEDGKVWEAQVGLIMENIYGNQIDGDTLIGGKTWKKVYNYVFMPDFGTSYYAAIRDEGKKVYAIAKGSNRPRLLYDFGLKEGEMARCGIEGNVFGCLLDKDEPVDSLLGFPFIAYLKVERIDTIEARGLQYRLFTLTLLDAYKEWFRNGEDGVFEHNIIWAEGVGSGAGPFSPWLPLPPEESLFLSCYENDTYIFGDTEFYGHFETNGLSNARYPIGERYIIYDLLGRHYATPPAKGVYIQNGKKILNDHRTVP